MAIRPTQALIGYIFADVITKQVPSQPNVMTSHPVEDGSVMSEHIAQMVGSLILDCTFTDDEVGFGVEAGTAVIVTTTADDKREAVKKLKDDRTPINVETLKDHYPNMVLLDIQEEITPQNASAFEATLVFEQARIVKAGMNKVPLDRLKKKSQGKKNAGLKATATQDQGTQSAQQVADDRAYAEAAAAVAPVFS
jgi:hypothetical protein